MFSVSLLGIVALHAPGGETTDKDSRDYPEAENPVKQQKGS